MRFSWRCMADSWMNEVWAPWLLFIQGDPHSNTGRLSQSGTGIQVPTGTDKWVEGGWTSVHFLRMCPSFCEFLVEMSQCIRCTPGICHAGQTWWDTELWSNCDFCNIFYLYVRKLHNVIMHITIQPWCWNSQVCVLSWPINSCSCRHKISNKKTLWVLMSYILSWCEGRCAGMIFGGLGRFHLAHCCVYCFCWCAVFLGLFCSDYMLGQSGCVRTGIICRLSLAISGSPAWEDKQFS